MGFRTLAAVVAALDILLGVVPCSAGVGHEDRKQNACHERSGEKSAQSLRSEKETDDDRSCSCDDTGDDHLAKGRDG